MGLMQSLLPSSKYNRKCPYSMTPIGVCVHNTYNDAPAINEITYMKNNDSSTSYHIAVDDKVAIQAIPFNRNAFHAGDGGNGTGNRKYIAVEICYSKSGGERFKKAESRAASEVATILKQYGWGIERVKAHRDFAKKDCPHRTNMTEFKKLVQDELNKLTNKTQQQQGYENAIIYSGDRDKAAAIIMREYLPNSTIVDIADYKSYMCRNAYAIGGGASKGLEKFPDNVTKFVGNNFKETYRKVVKWLENRKLM
ncbi:peptidoglycan recognition protein family protein [Metaclostridioides mangenotii]|uniref:N-acetylmuramoyl-L-alanine amidase n=1 Tax=Metaclostridioides mangenotii TaxID=1540 RepID=A0ABS4E9L6_9FIRM|nr:N-acetylmuramoyl-L-alanine amidase [Clostridioides mangenotii]MBP1854636.1 N-acetylmuramoyl-L-alanine amidase CwlA [Clostridioides mangenotii]